MKQIAIIVLTFCLSGCQYRDRKINNVSISPATLQAIEAVAAKCSQYHEEYRNLTADAKNKLPDQVQKLEREMTEKEIDYQKLKLLLRKVQLQKDAESALTMINQAQYYSIFYSSTFSGIELRGAEFLTVVNLARIERLQQEINALILDALKHINDDVEHKY
jgi:hypothetical protein